MPSWQRSSRRSLRSVCFSWITALHEITDGQVIAIDGKTLRRSFDAASSKSAIHMVSAWATANHISLGQVVTDAKSNEITAIPKLLEMLEITGCLVTIDAMGCQREIAQKIVDAKARITCLAVKDNQPTLHDAIVNSLISTWKTIAQAIARRHETHEKGHGRDDHALLDLAGARRLSRPRAVARPQSDRDRDQQHRNAAAKTATTCDTISSAVSGGETFRRGGARSLGH